MTEFVARIGGTRAPSLPRPALCDAWLADGKRFGDELPGLAAEEVLGRWPGELETDAVVRLGDTLGGSATWEAMAAIPPVAQKLAERARPQRLDEEIWRHLQHLQHVCHRPRLHLRVEEERVPVSRARRTPVRAVADLVSHPGDWEHRTLRSIQPSRVLARQIEDEWNLYENRVAARLVDHLLAYLARRLEELRKIEEALRTSRDHSDEARSSFWRARRVMTLWADTLTTRTEDELRATLRRLELAQRDLQALLDSPLYQRTPKRQTVPIALKPTNILINDAHYRKVAALWRAWVRYGHKRQETHDQRLARRTREAAAWDRFVLHLVVRAFESLGWTAERNGQLRWTLRRPGWNDVRVLADPFGVVRVEAAGVLSLLPVTADLSAADGSVVLDTLKRWDNVRGMVVVHVGTSPSLAEPERAAAWSVGGRAVLFGCSPWSIDSEERIARLMNGWLSRAASNPYPLGAAVRALPDLPERWSWVRYQGGYLVGSRAPNAKEEAEARAWAAARARELEVKAQQAKLAKQAFAVAPRDAVAAFERFVDTLRASYLGLDLCPTCGEVGEMEPRPGKKADGSDATWWAICPACETEWGLRPCTSCGHRYRALSPHSGLNLAAVVADMPSAEWPDRVLGRDLWAQPCNAGIAGEFRCPECGACSNSSCRRCPPLRTPARASVAAPPAHGVRR